MRNQTLGQRLGFIGQRIVWGLFAAGVPFGTMGQAACTIPVTVIGTQDTVTLSAEVMQTAEARAMGLMYRTELAPDHGMLFLYPTPRAAAFWMKNTYISLDIMFFDRSKQLLANFRETTSEDVTPLFGGDNVLFVLETLHGLEQRFALGEVEKISFDEGLARECGA